MSADALGDRMKAFEYASRLTLPGRMPVIIRVDGRAFHSALRSSEKPFDDRVIAAMNDVAMSLCREIQGAQLSYVQSDEVSVLVHNYKRLKSEAWFGNQVQKMVSVSASIATAAFIVSNELGLRSVHFDSRVFVLPESEVCNYFLWRQQDAARNSIQTLARSLYSHKECDRVNTSGLQEMCFAKGRNWNDLPTSHKRGRCAVKSTDDTQHSGWTIDTENPIFSQDRTYIERHLAVESEDAA